MAMMLRTTAMAALFTITQVGSVSAATRSDTMAEGVMQGFPPPADKQVNRGNAMTMPYMRWTFRHTRERAPTAGLRHSDTPLPLPEGTALNLDKVSFRAGKETLSVAEYLQRTFTDGFMVLHRGHVVAQGYYDGLDYHDTHIWASMTKSVTGLLAGFFIEEGLLDPRAKLSRYVPELEGTPFGEATLQQNLDMEVAVSYPEKMPPDLGLFAAVGVVPRRDGMPDNIYDFLRVPSQTEGVDKVWFYQNGSAEAVAWAIRKVADERWSELVSQRIWSRFADDDAYILVDRLMTEMASGGINATLSDTARFAESVRRALSVTEPRTAFDRAVQRVLSPRDNRDLFATGNFAKARPGYAYHNFWYHRNDANGGLECAGRFGQKIYIDPKRELVVVKLASTPDTARRATSAGTSAGAIQRAPLDTSAVFNAMVDAIGNELTD
jgi:CubicO group peptidase (beta-lactamase class C family)